mgnify:CR=1 FL=1
MTQRKEKSKITEEDLQMITNFRLMDDDFVTVVFDRNYRAVERVLDVILQRDDLKVLEVVTQREYKNPVTGGRSVKLDVYVEDLDGKIYDVEVQRADEGADVHRARFHSSMLDTRMLKENQKFKQIHDSYVIFITENDYFGKNLPLYRIERVVRELNTFFEDGSHIIYVNGSYENDDDPVGRLMHDFRCKEADDMFYEELQDSVRHFKETEGGRSQMCKAMEERIDRKTIHYIQSMMEKLSISEEQAIDLLDCTEEEKERLLKQLKVNADL